MKLVILEKEKGYEELNKYLENLKSVGMFKEEEAADVKQYLNTFKFER